MGRTVTAAAGPADTAGQAAPARVLLVGSSGGHLTQLVALRPWWGPLDRAWVTFGTLDARTSLERERVYWAYHPTTRNAVNLFRNALLAVKVLRDERPHLVVSTGAGVAVPFFAVARLFGIPTAYIEVYDRVDTKTLTARLCAPFTTVFCVQWEEQRDLYPDAKTIGLLL